MASSLVLQRASLTEERLRTSIDGYAEGLRQGCACLGEGIGNERAGLYIHKLHIQNLIAEGELSIP